MTPRAADIPPAARPYKEVRRKIRDGDVLLLRPVSLDGHGICVAGRSEFCHAMLARWWDRRLFAMELHSLHGGRAILLSHYVARRPGGVVWFRTNAGGRDHKFCRQRAVEAMAELMGAEYAWWDILLTALYHLPVARLLRYALAGPPPAENLAPNGRPFYCSGAVAHALCAGGHDPVPNLGNHWVEPGDLGRSDFLQRQCALLPDAPPRRPRRRRSPLRAAAIRLRAFWRWVMEKRQADSTAPDGAAEDNAQLRADWEQICKHRNS